MEGYTSAAESFKNGITEPVAEVISEEDVNMYQIVSGIVNRSLTKVIAEATA
ncbi:hypothetical protein SARC_11215, partial [Sphaeroforma arctica JP610]